MIRFECDYAEGMHPKILQALADTNTAQTAGYGNDIYSEEAKKRILKLCDCKEAEVHLIAGGTQTNLIVISSILRPHQGVISSKHGHIATHETGAIEASGHKVLEVENYDGKITATQIEEVYNIHWNDENHEHTVQPGMVYLSYPTEHGTIYSKDELKAIYEVCQKLQLPLFIDGARLGFALATKQADMTLKELSTMCDIFYIGGTKVGAMFGEAVVITKKMYQKDFRYFIKQRGALLAKGRFLGVQFMTLFDEDNLYFEISKNAIERAEELKKAFVECGFSFMFDSPTNMIFPILPNEMVEELRKKYAFFTWCKVDATHQAVRICTSFATTKEQVVVFAKDIMSYKK
ncbi:MAG: aminotransferase class I/II-fold pyridoxal phosphate-dependent enzyme [Bacillota bacterium]